MNLFQKILKINIGIKNQNSLVIIIAENWSEDYFIYYKGTYNYDELIKLKFFKFCDNIPDIKNNIDGLKELNQIILKEMNESKLCFNLNPVLFNKKIENIEIILEKQQINNDILIKNLQKK